jgi:hypothetical protein
MNFDTYVINAQILTVVILLAFAAVVAALKYSPKNSKK